MDVRRRPNKLLTLLYATVIGRALRYIFITGVINAFCSVCYSLRRSKRKVAVFAKRFKLDVSEFEKPIEAYETFHDFFIRKLKHGARLIDTDPAVLVAPSDSYAFVIPDISMPKSFFIKDTFFSLSSFIGDADCASQYEGGLFIIFRLALHHYHWFHFPLAGVPEVQRIVGGIYHSVHPIVYQSGFQPLLTNVRHHIFLKTEAFSDILVTPVGALGVGRIVEVYSPHVLHDKGAPAGYFMFGASTVVVLCKKGLWDIDPELLAFSRRGEEVEVKMGQRIAKAR